MKKLYFKEPLLRTNSGIYIDILNPTTDQIDINDICIHLSNHQRFGGSLNTKYSVLQHSLLVHDLVEGDENKLGALLHDASEAYLCDIPTPLKRLLPDYLKIETNMMVAIANKFGFEYPLNDAIHIADKKALEYEFDSFVLNDKKNNVSDMFLKNRFMELINSYCGL